MRPSSNDWRTERYNSPKPFRTADSAAVFLQGRYYLNLPVICRKVQFVIQIRTKTANNVIKQHFFVIKTAFYVIKHRFSQDIVGDGFPVPLVPSKFPKSSPFTALSQLCHNFQAIPANDISFKYHLSRQNVPQRSRRERPHKHIE